MYSLKKSLIQGAIKQFSLKITHTLTNPNQTSMKLKKKVLNTNNKLLKQLYIYTISILIKLF